MNFNGILFLVARSLFWSFKESCFQYLSFRFLQNQTIVWSSTMLLKGLWIKILYWGSLWMERICFVMQDLNLYQALLRFEMLYCKHLKWLLSIRINAIESLICFQMHKGYWMVKRAVGTKACLLGKAVTCRYFRQDNFLEVMLPPFLLKSLPQLAS